MLNVLFKFQYLNDQKGLKLVTRILIRKSDWMSSFICCICLLLKHKGISFLEMIQCIFQVPASVQASLNICLGIVLLLCSSAVQHSDVTEGIFSVAHSVRAVLVSLWCFVEGFFAAVVLIGFLDFLKIYS